ncbi:MAG: class I SAM-dependent methyltransferase [Patescibacteria group bacterium]
MKNIFAKIREKIASPMLRRSLVQRLRLDAIHSNRPLNISRAELRLLLMAPAFLRDDEIIALGKYAGFANSAIVEIGAAFGASSLVFMLNKNSEASLYSIDPFVKDSMASFQASEELCRRGVSKALADLHAENPLSKWQIIPDYSYNVSPSWQTQIDVIFIDGDHLYDAVKKDLEDWLPFVKYNGYILIHDSAKKKGTPEETYNSGWPGPTKLAEELKQDRRLRYIDTINSLTIWQKI